MQYFQKSIELDPADAAPHLSLGRIYAVRGEYDRSLEARPRRRSPGRKRFGGDAGEVSEPEVRCQVSGVRCQVSLPRVEQQ